MRGPWMQFESSGMWLLSGKCAAESGVDHTVYQCVIVNRKCQREEKEQEKMGSPAAERAPELSGVNYMFHNTSEVWICLRPQAGRKENPEEMTFNNR